MLAMGSSDGLSKLAEGTRTGRTTHATGGPRTRAKVPALSSLSPAEEEESERDRQRERQRERERDRGGLQNGTSSKSWGQRETEDIYIHIHFYVCLSVILYKYMCVYLFFIISHFLRVAVAPLDKFKMLHNRRYLHICLHEYQFALKVARVVPPPPTHAHSHPK